MVIGEGELCHKVQREFFFGYKLKLVKSLYPKRRKLDSFKEEIGHLKIKVKKKLPNEHIQIYKSTIMWLNIHIKEECITLYERMKREFERLDVQIRKIKRQIQDLPKGKLLCIRNGKYVKWKHSYNHEIKTISKKTPELAKQLAYKKYLQLQLDDLTYEQESISLYLKHHLSRTNKVEEFLNNPSEYYNLIQSKVTLLSEELQNWVNAPYQKNTMNQKKLIHRTGTGKYVRSKSEALIAIYLENNNIPYRYECLISLGKNNFYPDFTIRHPVTGEIYYWEHLGMMDNQDYADKAFDKIRIYNSYGIIPSINLILTYETRKNPLSTETIENIIEFYFK